MQSAATRMTTSTAFQDQAASKRGISQLSDAMLCVTAGEMLIEWRGHSWRARQGDLVMLPFGDPIRINCLPTARGFDAATVHVPAALVESFEKSYRDLITTLFDRVDAFRLVVPMSTDVRAAWSRLWDAHLGNQADVIVGHLIQHVMLRLVIEGVVPPFNGLHRVPLARRVQRILATRPERALRVAEVAKQLKMTEPTLRRQLARYGASFRAILDDVRMSGALENLMSTDLPIRHVAAAAGYHCASRFTARFKSRYGLTPLMLRSVRADQIMML